MQGCILWAGFPKTWIPRDAVCTVRGERSQRRPRPSEGKPMNPHNDPALLCETCGHDEFACRCAGRTPSPDPYLPALRSVDRSQIARALAKAIAYAECGKPADADAWARTLVSLLGSARILRTEV